MLLRGLTVIVEPLRSSIDMEAIPVGVRLEVAAFGVVEEVEVHPTIGPSIVSSAGGAIEKSRSL